MTPELREPYLADLASGRVHCPFCAADGAQIEASPDGLEILVEVAEHDGLWAHGIYCRREGRRYQHVYAPTRTAEERERLTCPQCACGEIEDVLPQRFGAIAAGFVARLECTSCGADVGQEAYRLVDVREPNDPDGPFLAG
jgi:hypothetical protein